MTKVRGVKKLVIAAFVAVSGVLGLGGYYVANSANGDCSSNSVIKCGVSSVSDMRDAYNSDRTKGTKTIFSYLGISSSTVNSARVVNGSVTRDGNVLVGNKVVATDALTAGRQYMPGSTKHVVSGTTFYTRTPAASFQQSSLSAYVFLSSKGEFMGAVIIDCGNPVKGKNKVEPPKPVYTCDKLTASPISRLEYKFSASATAKDGAKVSQYAFDFGDGKTVKTSSSSTNHTYAKPGSYTTKVTVYFTVDGKTVSDSGSECTVKVTIKDQPKLVSCKALTRHQISRTESNFTASAEKEGDATVTGYVFTVKNSSGTTVTTKNVRTNSLTAKSGTVELKPGTYTAMVTVKTSLGDKTSGECKLDFTIKDKPKNPDKPGVMIEKTVNGSETAVVDAGKPFTYEVRVTNTGNVDLKNVKVTDEQPEGVIFQSADKGKIEGGVWTYTIPLLKQGESNAVSFKITAVVNEYHSERIVNTACVDADEVTPNSQGDNGDDCDDASTTMKKPEQPPVEEESPVEEETPTEIPQTGPAEAVSGVVGLGALTAAAYYYVSVRRQI